MTCGIMAALVQPKVTVPQANDDVGVAWEPIAWTSGVMHELTLSASIIDTVVECARRERIVRVSRVVIEIGIAASVDPQALLFCFPITAAETVAADAELVINRTALKARCNACQAEYAPENVIAACPACGSFARTILAGREMRVVSFDGK
jgi:hydrogenase nickel incorporation protein HypA/HybF